MSEYQCYEFVALDRPLTSKQMAELRVISTRAEITPTRFWKEYQWGDLKADPAKLVERYFDAHMYFANWGTHRLILRIPTKRVDVKALRAYFVGDTASARVVGEHLLVDLHSEDEEPEYYEENQGSLGALTALRTELMRGDSRVAYLAWLLAVQTNDVDDGDREPPVPPGLSELTAAQAAMVEFLRIDEDLLAAAAGASAADTDDTEALRAWAVALSPRAKDQWLARAIEDPDLSLGAELRRTFRDQTKPASRGGRRVAELRAAAESVREARERAEAVARERAKKAADATRRKRLDALSMKVGAACRPHHRVTPPPRVPHLKHPSERRETKRCPGGVGAVLPVRRRPPTPAARRDRVVMKGVLSGREDRPAAFSKGGRSRAILANSGSIDRTLAPSVIRRHATCRNAS